MSHHEASMSAVRIAMEMVHDYMTLCLLTRIALSITQL